MKLLLWFLSFFCCVEINAQIPPAIQWQKCFGGSDHDAISSIKLTPDGGYIMAGSTMSGDGDITSTHGYGEAWIIKTDAAGSIQWQRTYGGIFFESATDIELTPDGGYIFAGTSNSDDGDVSGNHGGISDVWVVKLNITGIIQWQKCYGGPGQDNSRDIDITADGGYIISAQTTANGGDVAGFHGPGTANDLWLIKTDIAGNIQWQKTYGGTLADEVTNVIQTSDGGYLVAGSNASHDGDISCTIVNEDIWVAKLNNAGIIQWQQCIGGNFGDVPYDIIPTQDGGFITTGIAYSNTLPGTYGNGDGWVIKWDAAGSVQWQRFLGGTGRDDLQSIIQLADGSFLTAGSAASTDIDVCNNKGLADLFIVKLNNDGSTQWRKAIGGTRNELAISLQATTDGGIIIAGYSESNDGDANGNHGYFDGWVVKLNYPGIPLLPTISIAASKTNICPGQQVTFIATITDGGSMPVFQWMINGVNTGSNNDTLILTTLNDGDMVSCVLTSNSPCVTTPTANSNTIFIHVDPAETPSGFLPAFAEICDYGDLELKPSGSYKSYLWSTYETSTVITVDQPGIYWLQVVSHTDCPGSDTIVIVSKECLRGLYVPSAFTPNNDGRNDILKPILGGHVKQYKFTVYNRWGQPVFSTSDLSKGWNGKFEGLLQDSHVFIWVCTYQFEGDAVKTEKGTVVVIR